jgi:hypothetical protein
MRYSAVSALAKSAECKTILQITQSPIEMAMVVKQPAKPYKRLASWELLHITTYIRTSTCSMTLYTAYQQSIFKNFLWATHSELTTTPFLMSPIFLRDVGFEHRELKG